MESSSSLLWLSFRQKPRQGQIRVFEALKTHPTKLNIKLPTGYGKTYAACGVYSILKRQGRVNRLLIIVPNEAQRDQYIKDAAKDLGVTLVEGPHNIIDISYFDIHALKKHRLDVAQVFVITVQALSYRNGMSLVRDMLQTGQWMIVVDEYHHYGEDKTWGKTVLGLSRAYLLAMSATPSRPDDDSAFGLPDISVSYREAKDERAVKPLRGHSYNYKIDAVMDDGEIASFTTEELIKEAGGDGDKIEKLKIKRKMRWSPKYVSPLVSIPVERMQIERVKTGQPGLQALVGAMCVSHAELVCKQLQDIFPELRIDWVGTGMNGRPPEKNAEILNKFCPAKDEDGNRPKPNLDVLVHVGIAGEGLDSIYVSEVVHLNNATLCNKRLQENGRSSRYLPDVIGNINFDSSSEFAGYVGEKIMDAMDYEPINEVDADDSDNKKPDNDDLPELPEEPTIQIFNMELLNVDSGDVKVQRMARIMEESGVATSEIKYGELMSDLSHPHWGKIIEAYRAMRSVEAEAQNEPAKIAQWKESVDTAVGAVTHRVIKMMHKNGVRPEKSLIGDIKRRINSVKKAKFGPVQPDVEICRQHYRWLKRLEIEIIEKGVPSWLL